MRALTVRQPWAWAIVDGGKDVENRTRNIAGTYRGPVAIHAGQQYAPEAWEFPPLMKAWRDAGPDDFDYGHIIGVADLTGVHRCWNVSGQAVCSPWAENGAIHLALTNPRRLARPIPARGQLGLWRVPDDLEHAIREQVQP